jgi:hypothetical protein
MTFIKDELYTENADKFFEYFQYNFKTDKEGSHPANYKYYLRSIPRTFFKAVDVHYDNGAFFRRYLIIAVQNGNSSKLSAESYQEFLDYLCELPNPVGSFYSQGIALIIVEDKMNFSELILQKELRLINCGN